MTIFSKPKTSPSVKTMKPVNREGSTWEIRLGALQLIILLGVVSGGMFVSFYFGLLSGQKAGFEGAMETQLATSAKLPVLTDQKLPTDLAVESSDVLAKLEMRENTQANQELPQLGQIPSTDEAPLAELIAEDTNELHKLPDNLLTDKIEQEATKTNAGQALAKLNSQTAFDSSPHKISDQSQDLFVMSGKNAATSRKTLGALAKSNLEQDLNTTTSTQTSAAVLLNTAAQESAKKEATKIVEKSAGSINLETKSKEKVKEEKVKTVETDSSFVKAVLPNGWYAQIAAPREMKDANKLANTMKLSGFPVVIEVASVRGQEYYRVLVGPEQNRVQAEELKKQLQRESALRDDPILKFVK